MSSTEQQVQQSPGTAAVEHVHSGRESRTRIAPATTERIALAAGLFMLAPLIAEFLLGNIAIDALPALLVLAPMYGGAALLIREVARRTGRGWPTMILLGLAFGVFEEELVTQSLFNPGYAGAGLLSITFVPMLGIGVWWTLFVLTLHTVWSTSVPIALVEALAPAWRETPWLGKIGLGVTALLLALGAVVNFLGTFQQYQFVATPGQLAGTVAVVLALIVLAFRLPTPAQRPDPVSAPDPWLVGGFAFAAASLFMGVTLAVREISGWVVVAAYLAIYAAVIGAVTDWSRRTGWGAMHVLALAGGALLTYAWHAIPQPPVLGSTGTVDLIGNVVFGLGAVILLAVAVARQRAAQANAAA